LEAAIVCLEMPSPGDCALPRPTYMLTAMAVVRLRMSFASAAPWMDANTHTR